MDFVRAEGEAERNVMDVVRYWGVLRVPMGHSAPIRGNSKCALFVSRSADRGVAGVGVLKEP